jgi:hypothetical protein
MLRATAGVIVGYLAMFLVVFVLLSGAFLALGVDRTFQPGTYDVTTLWLVVWFAVTALAGLAGGYVCAALSASRKAPVVLAGLVLLLGLAMAAPVLMAKPPEANQMRGADVGNLEAMQYAREPVWVAIMNPVLGAAGAILGARRVNLQPSAPKSA